MTLIKSNSTGSRRLIASAISAAACVWVSAGSASAKATFVTFATGRVTGINSTDTATGLADGFQGFVRTVDGTITTFAVPEANATAPMSINDAGVVTGYYDDNSETSHGFARAADGTITTFDVRGASQTEASRINNKGEIAGDYLDSADHSHGFVRTAGGKIKTFDPPSADGTVSLGINDKGAIVGYYGDVSGVAHGFLRAADGSIITIDGPQAEGTFASAINNNGVITGWYDDTTGIQHGFIRTPDGAMTSFDDASCYVTPLSINRKGVVAGSCANLENPSHRVGFLRHADGTVKKFHVPGGGSTESAGINDAGVIGGYCNLGGFLRFP